MAKSLKDMTAAERRAHRAKTRSNKKSTPSARFPTTKVGRKTVVSDQRLRPQPVKRPAVDATGFLNRARASDPGPDASFEDMFLDIVQFLPAGEERDRAFSMFATFRKLPPDEQSRIVDSLMTQAEEATGRKFDKDLNRIKEDADFNRRHIERGSSFAIASFNRLKGDLDFKAIRDKSKVNNALGETVRRVQSQGFTTGVRGTSGLLRKRYRKARDEAKEKKVDIDIQKNQNLANENLALANTKATNDAQLGRLDTLEDRGREDLLEEEKEAERSLFLDLFSNQNSALQDQALANIATGAIGDTSLGDTTRTSGEDAVSSIAGVRGAKKQLANEKAAQKELDEFDAATAALLKSMQEMRGLDASAIPNMIFEREQQRADIENKARDRGVTPGSSQVGSFQSFLSGQSSSAPRNRSISAIQALSGVGVSRVGNTSFTDARAPANSSLDLTRQLNSGQISAADFAQRRNAMMMGGGQINVDAGKFAGSGRFAGQSDTSGGRGLNRRTASRISSTAQSRTTSRNRTASTSRITAKSSGGTILSRSKARGKARAAKAATSSSN